jgi:NAD(P)-dependent dehydrogenase (short-subunit alcohol dehydrogenase family)
MPVAIVTGASKGFGLATTAALLDRGWQVVGDARDARRLEAARIELDAAHALTAIPGDVRDAGHQAALVEAAARRGGLDLLVHNASALGPSPLRGLADHPLDELGRVLAVNVVAPVGLTQRALPLLRRTEHPTVVMLSSDAAVEAYPGWGGYGAAKAALDHLAAVLAVEQPDLRVYAFDPGDMRTDMHQRAFPGEDISDRPLPETVVPALLRLLDQRPASGRFRAADLAREEAA